MAGRDDFIPYPTDRVVGTIADPDKARGAVEALLDRGIQGQEIDVLHGGDDLHRLDPTGVEHGFLAQFQRTLIRTLGTVEEYKHLRHHVEDVRAGKFVVMVLAKERRKRDVAAEVLHLHDAQSIGFYGRWAYQSLDDAIQEPVASPRKPSAGHVYELEIDGAVSRVRLEAESLSIVPDVEGAPADARAVITPIRSGVFLLSRQDANGAPVVQVIDLETGVVHESITESDGTFRHVRGTVKRDKSASG